MSRQTSRFAGYLFLLLATLTVVRPAHAQIETTWVPQNFLRLLHATEVHQELGLNEQQVLKLETIFESIDGDWFRSRNLQPEERVQVVGDLEDQVRDQLRGFFTDKQIERLGQLEAQSQAARVLLRPRVATALQLTPKQKEGLKALFGRTEMQLVKVQKAMSQNKLDQSMQDELVDLQNNENRRAIELLSGQQQQQISKLLGTSFDLTNLQRVYPMAPDLEGITSWINSNGIRLKDLRGKVVAVHFYAYQCHNCHANLPLYNDFVEEFGQEDFVMIGIHSPETASERSTENVTNAAKDWKIDYPVAVDTNMETWKTWSNTMWPTIYLIDRDGYLRYWWQGELQWQGATHDKVVRKNIRTLLDETSTRG